MSANVPDRECVFMDDGTFRHPNFVARPFVELLKQLGAGIAGGNSKVDGFISNTANYSVIVEPYITRSSG